MRSPSRKRYPLWLTVALALAISFALSSCETRPPLDDGRIGVVVSVLPQRYFVERVGGEHVRVMTLVGPGDSPHTYEPKPAQLAALSNASVYFTVGVSFESAWLGRITAANPAMRVVDTAANITRLPLGQHETDNDDPSESGLDEHVWVSPRLVAQQAQVIGNTLSELDPAHAAEYRANLDTFLADIDALDADLRATFADMQGRKFMVFHPAWGYLAHDYGLEQVAVEVSGQEPSAQELAQVIGTARAEGIKVIFAQPEFSTTDAETIAQEIGGRVLLVSPLSEDWLANMRSVAAAFAEALAAVP